MSTDIAETDKNQPLPPSSPHASEYYPDGDFRNAPAFCVSAPINESSIFATQLTLIVSETVDRLRGGNGASVKIPKALVHELLRQPYRNAARLNTRSSSSLNDGSQLVPNTRSVAILGVKVGHAYTSITPHSFKITANGVISDWNTQRVFRSSNNNTQVETEPTMLVLNAVPIHNHVVLDRHNIVKTSVFRNYAHASADVLAQFDILPHPNHPDLVRVFQYSSIVDLIFKNEKTVKQHKEWTEDLEVDNDNHLITLPKSIVNMFIGLYADKIEPRRSQLGIYDFDNPGFEAWEFHIKCITADESAENAAKSDESRAKSGQQKVLITVVLDIEYVFPQTRSGRYLATNAFVESVHPNYASTATVASHQQQQPSHHLLSSGASTSLIME